MKYLIIAAISAVICASAYACTTQTVISPDGKAMICTTCCDGRGNCNTYCV